MQLTIDQALQQGVAAHKEGKLQDAERLYRAILESQPKHPDANHNLGVLAVSLSQIDAALPLFRAAIDANSKIEQFWLSYIDALIKAKQFENAQQAIKQAKELGFLRDKIDYLAGRLPPKTQKFVTSTVNPPQETVNRLMDHYHSGRFNDAVKLAKSITHDFPEYPLAWKVLGAVFGSTGRISEACDANQKAVALTPEDADAHSSLGATYKELGRLDEAEASCRHAIALQPDFAQAHYNLGIILHEMGQLDDAEESYKHAIELKPDFDQAHFNLGNMLNGLGRLEEAEASYTKTVELKPGRAEAHNHLGNTLQQLGRFEETESIFNKVIELQPDHAEAHNNLGYTLHELGRFEEAKASYQTAIALQPDFSVAHSNLGVVLQELGKLGEAIRHFDLGGPVFKSLERLYINEDYDELFRRIDSISKLDPKNIGIAALSAFVAHQLKRNDPYPFCPDPLDFVLQRNLVEYDQEANSILEGIVQEADKYELVWESRTTKCGFQGLPNYFDNPTENAACLERILLETVDDYYDKFKHDTNSFIRLWPKTRRLTGWYNRLLKNGYQTAHIHPTGWLSGVIYLKTVSFPDKEEGAIEFSLHGHDLPLVDKNYPRKLLKPKKGDIILFPSSLFHKTIPFSQDTERCVVAFDLKQ